MQCVGEANSVSGKRQGRGHRRLVLGMHVVKAKKPGKGVNNRGIVKAIKPAQDPGGLKYNRLCNLDRITRQEGPCGSLLRGVVACQQTDQDVSIDCIHAA
jgi:hypothetical protein